MKIASHMLQNISTIMNIVSVF